MKRCGAMSPPLVWMCIRGGEMWRGDRRGMRMVCSRCDSCARCLREGDAQVRKLLQRALQNSNLEGQSLSTSVKSTNAAVGFWSFASCKESGRVRSRASALPSVNDSRNSRIVWGNQHVKFALGSVKLAGVPSEIPLIAPRNAAWITKHTLPATETPCELRWFADGE